MVRNSKHAKAIQTRRDAAGKRGYAKAVRRWAKRHAAANRLPYSEVLNELPVRR